MYPDKERKPICPKSCYILYSCIFFLVAGCKKFITVDPPKTQIVWASVFTSDASAKSAMDGIYSQMMSAPGFANGGSVSISALCGLSADEFSNFSATFSQANFHTNSLDASNAIVLSAFWQPAYQYIYYSNAVIEGLDNTTGVSAGMTRELKGEAKFIRAFCNFYLVNLFGDIPLPLSTDYRTNAAAARKPKQEVYQQIIADLKEAQDLLVGDYSFSKGERVRPNKWAATALLARVYLYTNDWISAEVQSSSIINNTVNYSLVQDLNKVFYKNSQEAIWQLMPLVPGSNTNEGINFILNSTPNNIAIAPQLINAFEAGDLRKDNWVGSITVNGNIFYYPYKYKIKATGQPLSEYSMMLRLSEQYLIRAEARAQLNNTAGAQLDLNAIRGRSGLQNTMANDKLTLLQSIVQERRTELFSEWGHRWLDLKRINLADSVLGPIKFPNWHATDILYPIPQTELNNNSGLVQNPGY
jgi:hypothetical protein